MSLKDDFKKLAGVRSQGQEGERSDLRRKLINRVGRIEKGLNVLAKQQDRTNLKNPHHDKDRELIMKAVHDMSDEEIKQMLANLKAMPTVKKHIKEQIEILENLQWKNSDIHFAVVLTPTKQSTFEDIYSEVDTTGLKRLILGTPKDELDDVAIFPANDKEKAKQLAKARLQMLNEQNITEDIEETYSKKEEWVKAVKEFYPKAKILAAGTADRPDSKLTVYDSKGNLIAYWEDAEPNKKPSGTIIVKVEETVDVTDWEGKHSPDEKTRKELLANFAKTKNPKDAEKARKAGASQKELQDALNEEEQPKITTLDVQQGDLEKQAAVQEPETIKVPQNVLNDIEKTIKEVKFNLDYVSHIDSTYEDEVYWNKFIEILQQIHDTLKQGATEEILKDAMIKLQTFENVALVKVPDSLWKFLSRDMYQPPKNESALSLSTKFQEIKRR